MKPAHSRTRRESGAIAKTGGLHIPVAIVYPNRYRVGMANLGFQFVYRSLNSDPRFSAERVFFPDPDSAACSRAGVPRTEESRRPLSNFPLIAFSVPFENDYPAIPGALIASGIPPLQSDRGPSQPLVIAGGVAASLNPEPLASFVDLVYVGELETNSTGLQTDLFDVLADVLRSPPLRTMSRQELLHLFRDVASVYVPSAYSFLWARDDTIRRIDPQFGFPSRVQAWKRPEEKETAPVSTLFSPDTEFGDNLLVETSRGCGRGCRFCAAGWIHRPVRHAGFESFRKEVDQAISQGRTVGLIGSDLAGHPELEEMLSAIVDKGGTFSLSSISPEGLTPRVIELMVKAGRKTATLAPETASDRLKKVVGKPIPSEQFYELVHRLVSAGIPNIRFYFMIGLPTETDGDASEIVRFAADSRRIFVEASRAVRKIGHISVQLNPFVPKPWTPFQWSAMAGPGVLKRRMAMIVQALAREPNVVVRAESPRQALIQAALSRGDRRLAPALLAAAEQQGKWSGAFKRSGVDRALYALRERDRDEIFPWDVVDHGIEKDALWRNYVSAMKTGGK